MAISNERAERLRMKYSGIKNVSEKKAFSLGGPGGRNRSGLRYTGKPKDAKKTILELLKYIEKERFLFVLALLCALLFAVGNLTAGYMIRPLINRFIYYDLASSDISARVKGLFSGLVVLAFVYVFTVLCQWLQQRLMLTVSQRSLKRLRQELFDKLQTLPLSYFDEHTTGDVMSRFTNDIDTVGEMLNTTLIKIISGAITIVGTVFLMLYTNLVLGAITILMMPLLTYASKTIVKKSRGAYQEQQQSLGAINGYVQEMVTGQKVVKVFYHEAVAVEEFAYLNDAFCEAQMKAQFRAGIMGPVTHQMCNICYGITACVGGLLVIFRGFDFGGLTVSLNYTRKFNRPINEISMQMNTIFAALAGAERVFEVLEESPEGAGEMTQVLEVDQIRGDIAMEHVNFGYKPEVTVLHDISLHAKPGQRIAFVGATGAGKTTVTNLLSRFYNITEGRILIDGISIEQIDRKVLRSNIAMVLQETHLFTGTVRENIRYGCLDASDEEVVEAAKIASAHHFIMRLENGYDTVLEQDGANLSQGQRQLLNIARAAISKAPILILDEATSSVDTRTEQMIQQGMDAIMRNRTTFVIAHRLSTVRQSDAIMVLEHGHIVERGTHKELLQQGGHYASLYRGGRTSFDCTE